MSSFKIGQHPPLQDFFEIERQLQKNLDKNDLKLFRQAQICRSSNFGIAAVSYLRRVIEHALNRLMDLIVEASEGTDLSELPTMKSRRVEEKIEYVSRILPNHLKQGGHNPLDLLYALFSDGLHNKTDEECVQVFDDALYVFQYLFRNLGQASEEARNYKQKLGNLAQKAGKVSEGRE